jgi:UDP-N-acetylglucosamine 2-epimerase (non-hydrolysing)
MVTEPSGVDNLRREGIGEHRIHLVGNCMIDTLLSSLESARSRRVPGSLGLSYGGYVVLTLHRPSNVDDPEVLAPIIDAVCRVDPGRPVVWPVHPRTRDKLSDPSIDAVIARNSHLRLIDPLGYLDFLGLLDGARCALTDSGGLQEETTALGIPCVTMRDNTERPITIDLGTNALAGTSPPAILDCAREQLSRPRSECRIDLWDGHAAQRITETLLRSLRGQAG